MLSWGPLHVHEMNSHLSYDYETHLKEKYCGQIFNAITREMFADKCHETSIEMEDFSKSYKLETSRQLKNTLRCWKYSTYQDFAARWIRHFFYFVRNSKNRNSCFLPSCGNTMRLNTEKIWNSHIAVMDRQIIWNVSVVHDISGGLQLNSPLAQIETFWSLVLFIWWL